MSADDWTAWGATADMFLCRPFIVRYWQRVHRTFEPAFQRFVNERMRAAGVI